MYTITDVTTRIDQQLAWVMGWTLIAWGTGFVQIYEAVRLSLRDKMAGMPMGMAVFLLAHDSTYLLRAEYWLHTVKHWYFTVFLVGMVPAVLIELFIIWHFLRYVRPRLAAQVSPALFFATMALFLATAYLLLWWLQSATPGDPLFLISLAGTQVAAVIFNIPMLLVRGNTAGQSRLFAWTTLLGPGSLALGLFPALSPIFQTWHFAGVAGAMLALSVLYVVLLEQYRRHPAR